MNDEIKRAYIMILWTTVRFYQNYHFICTQIKVNHWLICVYAVLEIHVCHPYN